MAIGANGQILVFASGCNGIKLDIYSLKFDPSMQQVMIDKKINEIHTGEMHIVQYRYSSLYAVFRSLEKPAREHQLVDIDGESGLSNDDQNPEIEFVEEIIYVTTINIVLGYFRSRVMRVGSNTFSDLIFQKGLQNQPSSGITSVLGCFAQICQLGGKCENWTFKVTFLCQKSSEFFFH